MERKQRSKNRRIWIRKKEGGKKEGKKLKEVDKRKDCKGTIQ